tara:strand:+ start:1859 stop:4498 length:2640 start_codon:yes stop_codon:yes gene_type:complete
MSVQLILYPQDKATSNEFLVNGINFTGLSATTLYNTTAVLPSQDAITNSPPTINLWFRYTTTGGSWGTVAPPLMVSNNLQLDFNATVGRTGVYQKLSGLTIGQSYTVTINIVAAVVGTLRLETYTGSILQSTTSVSSNTTQVTVNFVANSVNDTMLIEYESIISIIEISDISIKGRGLMPKATFKGQVIVDLYEDEDIPLTLSVDNFKNVAEKVQSYSKSFNLPATKRNNQIFTNLFEVTMVQDVFSFNPYLKTPCILKQNGFILFKGYLRLIDIQDKEAEISYNVNLYSEAIALKDVLENKTFQDMGFSELAHQYTYTNILASWTGAPTYSNPSSSGFRSTDTLKYPFVDWSHNYTEDATSGFPVLPELESAFRPFINIKYLLDRIFANTDFTWTSNFFDSADFAKLFMDFNWGGDGFVSTDSIYNATWEFGTGAASNVGTGSFKALRLIPEGVTGGVAGSTVPPNYDTSTYIITATTTNEMYNINYRFRLRNNGGVNTCVCKWVHTVGGVVQPFIDLENLVWIGSNGQLYNGSFNVALNTGDTLEAQFNGDPNIEQDEIFESSVTFTQSSALVNSAGLLALRGELGQWDFLKGLMTMFNLVSLPDKDNPNNITFEPYNDIFITDPNIVTHDWTDKVDVSEMKLTPLTDLNKTTIFKFAEDNDDYIFNVYKKSVGGHLYGSKVYDASGLTLLQGTDEIVAEPFAASLIKPLMSQFPDFITPAIYSYNADDGTSEGFDNSPRIMYNNGVHTLTSCTYNVPAQNGVAAVPTEDEFLQFSHLSAIPTVTGTLDFHFGECQLIIPVGSAVPDNLFNLYWLPYYSELYNSNTRTMSLKVALNPSDINIFKFNDKIFIKNRNYRVNNIQYKPNDLATVEFILIP